MIVRRPPKRVTPNPWYWLLAFVATYWSILVLGLLQQGRPLVANWITDSIATGGLLIMSVASPYRSNGASGKYREIGHGNPRYE
jgi:hypothetical protein